MVEAHDIRTAITTLADVFGIIMGKEGTRIDIRIVSVIYCKEDAEGAGSPSMGRKMKTLRTTELDFRIFHLKCTRCSRDHAVAQPIAKFLTRFEGWFFEVGERLSVRHENPGKHGPYE